MQHKGDIFQAEHDVGGASRDLPGGQERGAVAADLPGLGYGCRIPQDPWMQCSFLAFAMQLHSPHLPPSARAVGVVSPHAAGPAPD